MDKHSTNQTEKSEKIKYSKKVKIYLAWGSHFVHRGYFVGFGSRGNHQIPEALHVDLCRDVAVLLRRAHPEDVANGLSSTALAARLDVDTHQTALEERRVDNPRNGERICGGVRMRPLDVDVMRWEYGIAQMLMWRDENMGLLRDVDVTWWEHGIARRSMWVWTEKH